MKFVKSYDRFLKESKKSIDKNALIVEKQVLQEFSSNFWSLCMKSSVFTNEEKNYIQGNLINESVSLVNEEWEFLSKAIDWAAEKGDKLKNFVFDKIKKLRDGMKDFVKSMVSFAKKIFMGLVNGAKKAAKVVADKQKASLKPKIEELDKEKAADEVKSVKETFKWWGITAAQAKMEFKGGFADAISNQVNKAESNAVSSVEKNLDEAENDIKEEEGDKKEESLSSILMSTNDDVLSSFYKVSLIKEAEEGEKKEGGSAMDKCINWLMSFLGMEKIDPEAKAGKKLLWWGKLFLKVLSICLNPILKILEELVKALAKNALALVSKFTNMMGGPGPFKFALLGGLTAGLFGAITDSMLLGGVDFPGAEAMSAIKSWVAHALEHTGDILPGYTTIKYFLKGFCLSMVIWHIVEEIKHLAHGSHGAHDKEHGGEKHGEKPAAGAKPEAGKPAEGGAKPAEGAKPEAGKPAEGGAKPAEGKPA